MAEAPVQLAANQLRATDAGSCSSPSHEFSQQHSIEEHTMPDDRHAAGPDERQPLRSGLSRQLRTTPAQLRARADCRLTHAMTRALGIVALALLAAPLSALPQQPASPQPAPQRPAFEVATIRPATRSVLDAIIAGAPVGLRVQGDFVSINQFILRNLIQLAYGIEPDQLEGPDWLLSTTSPTVAFDIQAKLPAGATADQVPRMLQALLEDRFKLKVHHGTKEMDTLVLTVGPKGPKLARPDGMIAGISGLFPRDLT